MKNQNLFCICLPVCPSVSVVAQRHGKQCSKKAEAAHKL